MEQSQDYSFNKSHAACYALIAYRTAWLKANHPHEYMAALISSVMNTKDRVPFYVNACHEMGIEVLPPDVNESQVDFAVVEGKIRFGLNAVKNVGDCAARAIVAARERGRPVRVALGLHRARRPAGREQARARVARQVRRARLDRRARGKGMLEVLDAALAWGSSTQADRLAGQGSIFDLGGDGGGRERAAAPPADPAGRVREARAARGSRRRRSASTSPSIRSQASPTQLRRKTDCPLAELERRRDGEIVTVGGIVAARQAADDEEGRADGLPPPRRPHRRRRGRSSSTRSTPRRASSARPTGSSSSRAGSTTSRRARRS